MMYALFWCLFWFLLQLSNRNSGGVVRGLTLTRYLIDHDILSEDCWVNYGLQGDEPVPDTCTVSTQFKASTASITSISRDSMAINQYCRDACTVMDHCCSTDVISINGRPRPDILIGSWQVISCAQACFYRSIEATTEATCLKQCRWDVDHSRIHAAGCQATLGDLRFDTCEKCHDEATAKNCHTGTDCPAGCSVPVYTTKVAQVISCDKTGIRCDFHAPDKALSGTIPTVIGAFKMLNSIDLSNNRVSGSLPSSIGLLPRLVSLKLNSNELTGTLPSSLTSLLLLQSLQLQGNQFTGLIPSPLLDGSRATLTDVNLFSETQTMTTIPVTKKTLTRTTTSFTTIILTAEIEMCFAADIDPVMLQARIPSLTSALASGGLTYCGNCIQNFTNLVDCQLAFEAGNRACSVGNRTIQDFNGFLVGNNNNNNVNNMANNITNTTTTTTDDSGLIVLRECAERKCCRNFCGKAICPPPAYTPKQGKQQEEVMCPSQGCSRDFCCDRVARCEELTFEEVKQLCGNDYLPLPSLRDAPLCRGLVCERSECCTPIVLGRIAYQCSTLPYTNLTQLCLKPLYAIKPSLSSDNCRGVTCTAAECCDRVAVSSDVFLLPILLGTLGLLLGLYLLARTLRSRTMHRQQLEQQNLKNGGGGGGGSKEWKKRQTAGNHSHRPPIVLSPFRGELLLVSSLIFFLFDFLSDCLFVDYTYSQATLLLRVQPDSEQGERLMLFFKISVSAIVCPVLLNICFLVKMLSSPDLLPFWLHFKNNTAICSLVLVLACGNSSMFRLVYSGFLGFKAFKAPLPGLFKSKISASSLISNLFEDVPQLIVQLLVVVESGKTGDGQIHPIAVTSMVSSTISLLFGIVKGAFIILMQWVVNRAKKDLLLEQLGGRGGGGENELDDNYDDGPDDGEMMGRRFSDDDDNTDDKMKGGSVQPPFITGQSDGGGGGLGKEDEEGGKVGPLPQVLAKSLSRSDQKQHSRQISTASTSSNSSHSLSSQGSQKQQKGKTGGGGGGGGGKGHVRNVSSVAERMNILAGFFDDKEKTMEVREQARMSRMERGVMEQQQLAALVQAGNDVLLVEEEMLKEVGIFSPRCPGGSDDDSSNEEEEDEEDEEEEKKEEEENVASEHSSGGKKNAAIPGEARGGGGGGGGGGHKMNISSSSKHAQIASNNSNASNGSSGGVNGGSSGSGSSSGRRITTMSASPLVSKMKALTTQVERDSLISISSSGASLLSSQSKN